MSGPGVNAMAALHMMRKHGSKVSPKLADKLITAGYLTWSPNGDVFDTGKEIPPSPDISDEAFTDLRRLKAEWPNFTPPDVTLAELREHGYVRTGAWGAIGVTKAGGLALDAQPEDVPPVSSPEEAGKEAMLKRADALGKIAGIPSFEEVVLIIRMNECRRLVDLMPGSSVIWHELGRHTEAILALQKARVA